jgi:PAS domain S-box-containing protein
MEESAEELYEHAPCGYISTRPDGTFIKVNQTFLSWTGYPREELLAGKRLQELLTVGSQIFHETHYAPLLRMQGFVNEISLDLVHKDGRPLSMLVNAIQKKDESGKPLSNRTILFNISDRKKYERELLLARKKAEEAIQAKTEFVSRISHELRTPLNAIIGISNLLQDTHLSPQQEEYVRILGLSSSNLRNLINNLLDFNKQDTGRVKWEERSAEAASPAENAPDEQSFQGLKVLVAEDNEVNVFVLSRFLRKWGIEFDVVDTGRRALEKVTTGDYDLVLMDLQMPEMDGFEATRLIRLLPSERLSRLPIIALSASSRALLGSRIASAGFTDFIGKPFEPEELFMKLTLHGRRPLSATKGREQAAHPVQPPQEVSLEKFRRLTADDHQALAELSTITLKSCEVYKREFQEALETGNLEKFEFHAHKIKVTLELMQAHALNEALSQARKLLAEKDGEPARLRAALEAIHREMDGMIRALEEARKA